MKVMDRIFSILLPLLIPVATRWVSRQEEMILKTGQPLDQTELANARAMGVEHPEEIRLLLVDEIQGPQQFILRKASSLLGFFNPGPDGITYRYGILIRKDCYPDHHLVAHECVHTAQYERLGIYTFLQNYLKECLTIGYPDGPLEQEAINLSAPVFETEYGSS